MTPYHTVLDHCAVGVLLDGTPESGVLVGAAPDSDGVLLAVAPDSGVHLGVAPDLDGVLLVVAPDSGVLPGVALDLDGVGGPLQVGVGGGNPQLGVAPNLDKGCNIGSITHTHFGPF